MTKRTKKSKTQPTIVVIITLIIAVVTAIQQSRQPTTPSTPVATGLVTQILIMTATAAPKTQIPAATDSSSTLVPRPTNNATDVPGLEITPVIGSLYEVTGTVNALGCPDSRCKVIDTYNRRSIIVVTGTVMGTTYKTKKTRIWYQVISHNGNKVYIHGAFVALHNIGLTE